MNVNVNFFKSETGGAVSHSVAAKILWLSLDCHLKYFSGWLTNYMLEAKYFSEALWMNLPISPERLMFAAGYGKFVSVTKIWTLQVARSWHIQGPSSCSLWSDSVSETHAHASLILTTTKPLHGSTTDWQFMAVTVYIIFICMWAKVQQTMALAFLIQETKS